MLFHVGRLTFYRPQVNQQSLSLETNVGEPYRLDESLIERMMFPSNKNVQPIPFSRLNIQRRMHPDIADLMRATCYPDLKVAILFESSHSIWTWLTIL